MSQQNQLTKMEKTAIKVLSHIIAIGSIKPELYRDIRLVNEKAGNAKQPKIYKEFVMKYPELYIGKEICFSAKIKYSAQSFLGAIRRAYGQTRPSHPNVPESYNLMSEKLEGYLLGIKPIRQLTIQQMQQATISQTSLNLLDIFRRNVKEWKVKKHQNTSFVWYETIIPLPPQLTSSYAENAIKRFYLNRTEQYKLEEEGFSHYRLLIKVELKGNRQLKDGSIIGGQTHQWVSTEWVIFNNINKMITYLSDIDSIIISRGYYEYKEVFMLFSRLLELRVYWR